MISEYGSSLRQFVVQLRILQKLRRVSNFTEFYGVARQLFLNSSGISVSFEYFLLCQYRFAHGRLS